MPPEPSGLMCDQLRTSLHTVHFIATPFLSEGLPLDPSGLMCDQLRTSLHTVHFIATPFLSEGLPPEPSGLVLFTLIACCVTPLPKIGSMGTGCNSEKVTSDCPNTRQHGIIET